MLVATHLPQRFDCIGQRILFAQEPSYEAAPANEPARFSAAERSDDLAPWHGEALARGELSEDDAVASQQLSGDLVREIGQSARLGLEPSDERPAPMHCA